MYKRELQIIFNEADDKPKKGAFFEELIARVFKTQRYKIKERVNFTGMEIDLIAEHLDRSNEEIYIECKAKENLSSAEIKSFAFNTQFKKKKYGYFISVIDFAHQVSGLIEEMRNMDGYDNLYFFGPDKIIEFLTEAKFIECEELSIFDTKPTKLIVVYSYFGIFKIYLFSKGTISTEYTVLDHMNKVVTDSLIIKQLENYITEVADLEYVEIKNGDVVEDKKNNKIEENKLIESVAEVKRSEAWFDYLPTSQKHFVGRKDILEKYDNFIKSIKEDESEKRVFYIEGKSGWGKSSFVSTIRDKSLGKEGKKTEFVFAVDTRSASTTNFIALAFKKMLTAAKEVGFLAGFKNIEDIKIVSSFDILSSDSVKELFTFLKTNNKYLVIIFDQFEDIFRAESIFKVFYKFLIDTNNLCANLVVGFSWKTEITVPIGHEAYHLWQILKSETFCIEMRSFDALEVNGVINQLQKSLDFKLDSNIKRRIIESSQGFPWLTKKLCIHTYNEFHNGLSIDELMEQELNIKSLFDKDLEGLNSEELKALRFIAKRAFDGNMFDVTEDDVIRDGILFSLINKRLVIRSGQKYNIYWDIFRDYLVNDKITLIGESYILRVKPNICFDIFGYFKLDKKVEFEELKEAYKVRYTEKTLYNILRQLLDVGLISKNNTAYQINKNIESIDKSGYVEFLQKKFQRYTPYLKLIDREELKSLRNVMDILQDTFRGIDLKDLTWEVYTKTFISWIDYLGLKGIENIEMYSFETIENGQLRSRKSKNQVVTFTPQKPIRDDIMVLNEIAYRKDGFDIKNHSKFLYDLSAIGVLYYWKDDVIITKNGLKALACKTEKEFFEYIAQLAIKMDKIDKAVKIIRENDIQNIQDFRKIASSLVDHINSDIYKRQTLGKIYNWANFIVDINH